MDYIDILRRLAQAVPGVRGVEGSDSHVRLYRPDQLGKEQHSLLWYIEQPHDICGVGLHANGRRTCLMAYNVYATMTPMSWSDIRTTCTAATRRRYNPSPMPTRSSRN